MAASPVPFGPYPPPVRTHNRPIRRPSMADDITYTNAVYYPNYRARIGETPAYLNTNCISHVFYAFASVGSDGVVFLNDIEVDAQMDVDGNRGCLGSLVAIKQQKPHLKVILSIGGGASSENFAKVAASAALRDNFGKSAYGLVAASGLDGIDIDWEHPTGPQQGRDFLALLAAIRLHLPDDEYILSAALPAGQWVLKDIDLFKAQEYLDFINLMAYDFSGPWSQTAGHHAQLYSGNSEEDSGEAGINYVLSTGFPSKKILLGVPAYGRSFLGAAGPGDTFDSSGGESGAFEYKVLPRPDTVEEVDSTKGAAFCIGGDGGFVSYDNPATVKIKGKFCRTRQLGGLFFWTGTADIARGDRSLVEAGFNALHST